MKGLFVRLLVAIVFSAVCAPFFSHAQPATFKDVAQAEFLTRFPHYVTWPTNAFTSQKAAFTIGILGTDPFGQTLDKLVADNGGKIQDRPVKIERFATTNGIERCHMLFISQSEIDQMPKILEQVSSFPILTVGAARGFLRQGGIIHFLPPPPRLGFHIDQKHAKKAGLTISSHLMRLSVSPRRLEMRRMRRFQNLSDQNSESSSPNSAKPVSPKRNLKASPVPTSPQ